MLGDLAEDDEIERGVRIEERPREVDVRIDGDSRRRRGIDELVIVHAEVRPAHRAPIRREGLRDLAAARGEVEDAQPRVARDPARRPHDRLEDVRLRHF